MQTLQSGCAIEQQRAFRPTGAVSIGSAQSDSKHGGSRIRFRRAAVLFGFGLLGCPLVAQEAATQPTQEAVPTTQPAPAPSATGWERWLKGEKMTGNWGGLRDDLAGKGINFNLDITQIMQENAHGGADTHSGMKYEGSADLTLTVDTQKMGLWPGG